tara:strand:- start:237 stop:1046 length:810 start_codon:yes stop_codon:yes gene_type:complete
MFKLSSLQKTTPSPITLIPQSAFTWNLDNDWQFLSITNIDPTYLSDLDPDNFNLCIYGWDKEPKEFVKIFKLNSLEFPLNIKLSEVKFKEIIGKSYFRIRIYDISNKRIIRQSKSFTMAPDDSRGSLLPLILNPIGNKIAELDLDLDNGPVIKISSNFISKGQKIEARNLKQIAKSDPIFGCSFWPSVLKQIFEGAIDNIEQEWSQNWLRLANKLYPGNLETDRNNNLKPIDGKDSFKDIITNLIDKWIEEKGFDIELFNRIYEEGDLS